jgi:hypothetical protein
MNIDMAFLPAFSGNKSNHFEVKIIGHKKIDDF